MHFLLNIDFRSFKQFHDLKVFEVLVFLHEYCNKGCLVMLSAFLVLQYTWWQNGPLNHAGILMGIYGRVMV